MLISTMSRVLNPLIRHGAFVCLWIVAYQCQGQEIPESAMMRFPDVSADRIVFVYGEDLWTVSRDGGVATPLAAPLGEESLPRFSPDGSHVAFVGNYDGNQDVYVIPVAGGPAKRITYHPAAELLCDWSPDGKLIFSSNGYAGLSRQSQLFIQGLDEPLERPLPVPYGTNGTISADGKWLAYTPHSRDYRTWKRYRGGMASDVWLFNLETQESKQITDFEGTDTFPMWHGDVVYYLSDAGPEHRLNIWMYHTKTEERKQVTHFSENDCRWPSVGPGPDGQGEIILQNGSHLFLVDLKTEEPRQVSLSIPGDRPKLRPQPIDVSGSISSVSMSPNAKRIAVEARGDIWTLPASEGSPRNLTRSSSAAERDPGWSPDGRWIAYFSDASGEYELYITSSDGSGEPKQLTQQGDAYRYSPSWSPDSKRLVFTDKAGRLFLFNFDGEEVKQIDHNPTGSPLSVNWSQDGHWLTYSRAENNRAARQAIWVYHVENGTRQKLTSGFFNDTSPCFDRQGEFLYFASSRSFTSPKYEDIGTTFIYSDTQVLMALPLRSDVKNPLLPASDEETWAAGKKEGSETTDTKGADKEGIKGAESNNTSDGKSNDKSNGKSDGDKKAKQEKQAKPFTIDFADSESRAYQLPVSAGRFGNLHVTAKGLLVYSRSGSRGANAEDGGIKIFDPSKKEAKEEQVVDGRGSFQLSPDGNKMLIRRGGKDLFIVDAAANQKLEKKAVTEGMLTTIQPEQEWKQIYWESWRVQRDFFYDPQMHGVDWKAVGDHYAKMLDQCVTRRDVSYLIREMISELNVGHAYYREGSVEVPPAVRVGLPGCRLAAVEGGFRIEEIYQGAAWDVDARNPLIAAGVKAGQFLLAVNGMRLSADENPYQHFIGKSGLVVTLGIGDNPHDHDAAQTVSIRLLASDEELRFRHWIERNRRYVEQQSDGKIGYIYVVNTGVPGQNDLVRMLYGQLEKEALIIDDRWNGGGQIPTRFIELLNRPATNAWARRDGQDWIWPPDSHQGPKCMLINGMAGSGGDMFPALFKQNELGPLIGMRTWGGLVGISGGPTNVDGSSVTPPTFAYYRMDGSWGIEGHGVDPDIKVIDDPSKMRNGGDPQLDAAIAEMLKAIEESPFVPPQRPAYPDRSGFGIAPGDR